MIAMSTCIFMLVDAMNNTEMLYVGMIIVCWEMQNQVRKRCMTWKKKLLFYSLR